MHVLRHIIAVGWHKADRGWSTLTSASSRLGASACRRLLGCGVSVTVFLLLRHVAPICGQLTHRLRKVLLRTQNTKSFHFYSLKPGISMCGPGHGLGNAWFTEHYLCTLHCRFLKQKLHSWIEKLKKLFSETNADEISCNVMLAYFTILQSTSSYRCSYMFLHVLMQ